MVYTFLINDSRILQAQKQKVKSQSSRVTCVNSSITSSQSKSNKVSFYVTLNLNVAPYIAEILRRFTQDGG